VCYGLKVKGNGPSVVPDGRWGPTPLSLGRLAELLRAPGAGDFAPRLRDAPRA
jgi:hypothetical protein